MHPEMPTQPFHRTCLVALENKRCPLRKPIHRVQELEAERDRLREFVKECAKGPYIDSDLRSYVEWVSARASAALDQKSDEEEEKP